MYYVIEHRYVGPNWHDASWSDFHRIGIYTEPAEGNMSHEPITDGWAGTTNDVSTSAHGAYPTVAAAREALIQLAGEVRDAGEPDGEDETLIESYRYGRYAPADRETLHTVVAEIVNASTTRDVERLADETIDALITGDPGLTADRDEVCALIRDALTDRDE